MTSRTGRLLVEKDGLGRFLQNEYGLNIASLRRGPQGEESTSYVAATKNGHDFFVRLQDRHWQPQSISSYRYSLAASVLLHRKFRLRQAVAPILTRQSSPVSSFCGRTVAVFPFVRGRTLYKAALSNRDVAKAARLLAKIHSVDDGVPLQRVWRERFENPFASNILRLLNDAKTPNAPSDPYKRKTLHRIRAYHATITEAQSRMAALKVEIRRSAPALVLTHGDANLANFIRDARGALYLTDWGDAGLGPVERDLFHFSGRNLRTFLRYYTPIRPETKLSAVTFAFYYYRWALQEISDYGTRLLYLNSGPREKSHAWSELKQWVPLPSESISRTLKRIESILSKYDA